MKKWLVINNQDTNYTFEVEGKTAEEAAFEALNELGWNISKIPEDFNDN
jgi:hypothetical protein